MSKRKKPTSEAELQDAINRIGKNPEALNTALSKAAWNDYLINVFGVHPESVSHEKNQYGGSGSQFWENVRQGIIEDNELKPVKQQPIELSSGYRIFFDKKERQSIRNDRGQFTSYEEARLERPVKEPHKSKADSYTDRQIAEAGAYKATDRLGRTYIKNIETGKVMKI